jgi:hypothetical protein
MFDYDVEIAKLRGLLFRMMDELNGIPATDDPRRAAARRLEQRIGDLTIAKMRGIADNANDWIMPAL